ncbi:MAG: hypothetical protein AAFY55_12000 [Bacteroidota bacterium]
MRLLGLCLFLYVCALPTMRNVAFYVLYVRGQDGLMKVVGDPDTLVGVWEGRNYQIPCGQFSRADYRYVFDTDSTGILEVRWSDQYRIAWSLPDVWSVLLPFKTSSATLQLAEVRVENGYLVATDRHEERHYAYQVWGDRLRVGYVSEPGDAPSDWIGEPSSLFDMQLRDLPDFWGRHDW